MHLDVMTAKGAFSGESRYSDEELPEGWLDEPLLPVTTPPDDEESGACRAMQDVISHQHKHRQHSPWIWQMSPAEIPHSDTLLWTDNGESPGSLSPASASPSAFQIRQERDPTEPIQGLRKALSLPVPRKNTATAAERRRTRGPNVNPTKGNNKQGRLGKLRCLLCRAQHHKCEYEDVDLPCKHCSERGLPCGAKTWGQRRELRRSISSPPAATKQNKLPPTGTIVRTQPTVVNATDATITATIVGSDAGIIGEVHATPATDDEKEDLELVLTTRPQTMLDISSLDATYLAYYNNILLLPFIEERYDRNDTGGLHLSPGSPGGTFRRFPDLSSPVIKYATLLYAASFKALADTTRSTTTITGEYLRRYYKAAKEAIGQQAYAELVYACYAMCNYAFTSQLPFDETAQHAKHFLSSFKKLTESTEVSVEEGFLMKCMCKDIFCWLTGSIGTERDLNLSKLEEARVSESKAEKLYHLAETSIPLFQAEFDPTDAPDWMSISHTYMKTQMTTYRLQIYTNYLLTKLRLSKPLNFPQWFSSFSSSVREIGTTLSLNPQIRSLVDHSQLFKVGGVTFGAARRHDSTEWQLWQPSVVAHYKVQFRSQSLGAGQGRESVGEGMDVCRMIPWGRQGLLRMNSLSALRSLFLACLSISEIYSPESICPLTPPCTFTPPKVEVLMVVHNKIRTELSKVFDLERYLHLRSTESLLSSYDPGCVNAPFGDIMTVDAGGFLDCMGQLREDGFRNCASCGRPSCEYIEMDAFV